VTLRFKTDICLTCEPSTEAPFNFMFHKGDTFEAEPIKDNGESFDVKFEDGSVIYDLHGEYFEFI
jgi:hypothetical protein